MRHGFLRWLTGTPPVTVGAWWADASLCLVRLNEQTVRQKNEESGITVAYGVATQSFQNNVDSFALARSNLLKALMDEVGPPPCQLALAVPSADVFIQTIHVPGALDDEALGQLSVVEAVSNLPVPPEEVCADFIRLGINETTGQEAVRIAFCRRELIDGLIYEAESSDALLAEVDRDLQAFHDGIGWILKRTGNQTVTYPMVSWFMAETPFILVARDALDLIQYPIDPLNVDVIEQMRACLRRAGFSELKDIQQFILILDTESRLLAPDFTRDLGVEVICIDPLDVLSVRKTVPLRGFVAALGMAVRNACE